MTLLRSPQRLRSAAVGGLTLLMTSAFTVSGVISSFAQSPYPARRITIIVPFAPGSATDIIGRVIANEIEKAHGQPVIVENRAGGGGNPGTAQVAKSAADGYTLLLGAIVTAANQSLYKNLTYNTKRDLIPISQIASFPQLVAVHKSVGAENIEQFIKIAKEKKLNAASSGIGTSQHLSATLFELSTGVRFQHVYYKGSSAIVPDLMNGLVHVTFGDMVSLAPALGDGSVKPIAVTSLQRSPKFPDLPTVNEAGLPGFTSAGWYGLFAPTGTPPEVIKLLYDTVKKATSNPEVIERIRVLGGEPVGSDPATFAKFVDDETERWGKVAKAFSISIE